jgi:hypothetical protein
MNYMNRLSTRFDESAELGFQSIPSANSIAIRAIIQAVTGSVSVQTIVAPPNIVWVELLAIDGFAFVTGGNIAVAKTVSQGETVTLVLNLSDSLWYPTAKSLVAPGIIVMWSGLIVNIPTGWALCDGTNGTPDLRNSFIRSIDVAEQPGITGGAATHIHDPHPDHIVTQPDNHDDHVVTQPDPHNDHSSDGGHTHDSHTAQNDTEITGAGTRLTGPTTHASGGAHTHDAHSAHSGTAVDAHSAHTGTDVDPHSPHSAISNDPVFYKLAFIMRL